MGNNRRNKNKIRPHLVDKYNQDEIDVRTVGDLHSNLNGDATELKRIAKTIIKSLPKIKFKNGKQSDFHQLLLKKDVVACQGSAGTGKAQPLYSKIYTPNGYKLMGDIKLGDKICSTDGGITTVTGIYPQGIKDVYRIHFNDKTYVDCCGEHLWEVTTLKDREKFKKSGKPVKKQVLSTLEMVNDIVVRDGRLNFKIDVVEPLNFNEEKLIIDPYLIGCLIGDGGMTNDNTVISSIDNEILQYITDIISEFDLSLKKVKQYENKEDHTYRIINKNKKNTNILKNITLDLGLRCKSEHKRIPKAYLYNSIENRIKLLQGLMDTDGTIDKRNGSISFSTSSEQLKNDFCELIQGLGGIARVSIKKTNSLDNYVIHFNLPNFEVFRLKRKLKYVKKRVKYFPSRYIKHIEKIGEVEQQCIMVDHPNHLYVTDNCTITHNTFVAVYSALELLMNPNSKIEKIILTKPAQQLATENLGFIKGGLDEKIAPIMESFDGVFEELIGIANYRTLIEKGIIQYKPMAFLRGQTMKNAVILFDEVQMSSLHACRTLLQRLGEDSKIFLLGDKAQTENKNRRNNPLSLLIGKFENIEEFGVFEFTVQDIVRNKLIIIFERVFEEIENESISKNKGV